MGRPEVPDRSWCVSPPFPFPPSPALLFNADAFPPRLDTGIRRRGMTIEAITQFMLLQGPSQAEVNLEWDSVWNLNKKVIDPVAPRFVALEKEKLCVPPLLPLSLDVS